jgi:flavin reductase (DIM6/NTAB) family NADH-FMN oxidoreductase RutF/DNA-binding IclR family transcriptional regulator
MSSQIDPERFREVLGQYPTGVVVVTAMGPAGDALGMTVGSFTSVSIDPPLVAFLPSKMSSSWRSLRESGGSFCVNVLSSDQEDVCRAIAMRKHNKFDGIPWFTSRGGNPVVAGTVAYIDCELEAMHDAGDHHIVVGRVLELEVMNGSYPLLFFRGGYGSFRPLSLAAGDADLLYQLRLIDKARQHMEALASECASEVGAYTLLLDEIVIAAAAGQRVRATVPTHLGQRWPFIPPTGSPFAAWGGDAVEKAWLANLGDDSPADEIERFRRMAGKARARGYGVIYGHPGEEQANLMATLADAESGKARTGALQQTMRELPVQFQGELTDAMSAGMKLHLVTAPVFDEAGNLAFVLALWPPDGVLDAEEVKRYISRITKTAKISSAAISRARPHVSI